MTDVWDLPPEPLLKPPDHAVIRQRSSVAFGTLGLLAGFILALGILSGDAEGRVNLLYLLLLFAFLPVTGLILSLVFLMRRSSEGLAGWLLHLPIWPLAWRRELLALRLPVLRRSWLFYQTQVLALAFGGGGLLAFMLLLLVSDISFVWRSTLLQPTDLYPLLRGLSIPWAFWPAAQPSLELLQQSQDFRLSQPQFNAARLGQWWQYALAAQCTYNLMPRAIMLMVARRIYLKSLGADSVEAPAVIPVKAGLNQVPATGTLAAVHTTLDERYVLLDWANAPAAGLSAVTGALGEPDRRIQPDPLQQESLNLTGEQVPVVLVRSWEPPMGQLHDYLAQLEVADGFLLPLDWNDAGVRASSQTHLLEWRRFAGTLPNWSVLQPFASASESPTEEPLS